MEQVDWSAPLIAIKGTRGVGKTVFLLQYARLKFSLESRACLYVNLNHFYFTNNSIIDFATAFVKQGGETLLLDQVFKYPNWEEDLKICNQKFPKLKIVFTISTVMNLEQSPALANSVSVYNLRGFSYREFLNIVFNKDFKPYTLDEIVTNHQTISAEICKEIDPLAHLWDYQHHGYYPFFLEKKNFSENLLKTINMMLEVDVLTIKQIEHTYLPKLRKLLFLLAQELLNKPNISQLSIDCEISRATVTNYMECLRGARLINMLYKEGEEFPKKPDLVYLHNTNLTFPLLMGEVTDQVLRETFFYNQVHHADASLKKGRKNATFIVEKDDKTYKFKIEEFRQRRKSKEDQIFVMDKMRQSNGSSIPLWLFGFLY